MKLKGHKVMRGNHKTGKGGRKLRRFNEANGVQEVPLVVRKKFREVYPGITNLFSFLYTEIKPMQKHFTKKLQQESTPSQHQHEAAAIRCKGYRRFKKAAQKLIMFF